MRGRLTFIIVAIAIAGAFAGLNWSEITRSAPLSFGFSVSEAPMGLILLTMLCITLIVFLVSSAAQETRHQIDYGKFQRTLEAQRELADKAESSRFTDLRNQLELHLKDNRQREAIAATEFEKAMVTSQRELRTQLEAMHRTMAARLREIEAVVEGRTVTTPMVVDPLTGTVTEPVKPTLRDRLKL